MSRWEVMLYGSYEEGCELGHVIVEYFYHHLLPLLYTVNEPDAADTKIGSSVRSSVTYDLIANSMRSLSDRVTNDNSELIMASPAFLLSPDLNLILGLALLLFLIGLHFCTTSANSYPTKSTQMCESPRHVKQKGSLALPGETVEIFPSLGIQFDKTFIPIETIEDIVIVEYIPNLWSIEFLLIAKCQAELFTHGSCFVNSNSEIGHLGKELSSHPTELNTELTNDKKRSDLHYKWTVNLEREIEDDKLKRAKGNTLIVRTRDLNERRSDEQNEVQNQFMNKNFKSVIVPLMKTDSRSIYLENVRRVYNEIHRTFKLPK